MRRPAVLQLSAWCRMALAAPRDLYGATGAAGASEKSIGAPGSMLIGPCVLGGNLGPVMSKDASALVLVRSSSLDVEARGGACAHVINVVHSGVGITSMVGA